MPSEDFFPDNLKELSLKNVPEFNFSFFEAYLDKLVEKEYLLSKPNLQEKSTSVFKFYSNENCQVYKEDSLSIVTILKVDSASKECLETLDRGILLEKEVKNLFEDLKSLD